MMTEQFDDQLLDEFTHKFYGYGNYNSPYWFIGMEEGGGNSFAEIAKRLDVWAHRGKLELEDLAEYHNEIGLSHYFREKPTLQLTWSKLIRILLSVDGKMPITEHVREYQRTLLGRTNGQTCLAELLPLPSPSTSRWLYAQHSQLPYLADRERYKSACLTPRIEHLNRQIKKHNPQAVVFYGFSYYEYWQKIAEVDFLPESNGMHIGRGALSLFIITKHPAAKGITNEYFHKVGQVVNDYWSSESLRR